MKNLVEILTGWKEGARKGDAYFNPKEKKKRPRTEATRRLPKFREGTSEAEKLRLSKQHLKKLRAAKAAAKQPPKPKKPKKSWYQKGLYDLFK